VPASLSRLQDDEIRNALTRFSNAVSESAASVDRQFRAKIAVLGLSPEQRALVLRLTPGAAVRAHSKGVSIRQFLVEAAASSRQLALCDVDRGTVLRMLPEYAQLTEAAVAELPAGERGAVRSARTHLLNALRLAIHEAWALVGSQELQLMNDLLAAEHESQDEAALAGPVLRVLVAHFGAAAGTWFRSSETALTAIASEGVKGTLPAVHAAVTPGLRHRVRALDPDDPLETSAILVPAWRGSNGSVWSVPAGESVVQLQFAAKRAILTQEQRLLRMTAARITDAVQRLAREERLRGLSIRMLEVEELERRRIARELHDDAGQALVVARLQLEMLEISLTDSSGEVRNTIAEIRGITEKTILGVRRLISDLSPAVLEQLGLGAAIRQLGNRFRSSYQVSLRLHLPQLPRLDPRLELVLYRVLQECFSNISRHSQATRVNVSVTPTDRTLKLTVEDNGVGFRVEEGLGRRNCFGLLGIRERVSLIGGRFQVESELRGSQRGPTEHESGTKVVVEIPLRGEYPNSVQL